MNNIISKGYLIISSLIGSAINFIFLFSLFIGTDIPLSLVVLSGSLGCTFINIFFYLRLLKEEKRTILKCILAKGIVINFSMSAMYMVPGLNHYFVASCLFCGLGVVFIIALQCVRKIQ